jgi:pimeloyl-ACP methyl ester carboxylesterase
MSIVFINDSAVHFESLGRGRPVLFLHTWVGSWRYWVPSLQTAAASHSAYAIDLLGFGETARDPLAPSLERQAALVQGFLDEMGIGRIAIVGHGLGALVGLTFAGLQLSRVARIMTIAMPLDPMSVDDRLRSSTPAELLDLISRRSGHSVDLFPSPAAMDARLQDITVDATRIQGTLAALCAVEVPCLIVYGSDDLLLRPPSPDHTAAFGPYLQHVVLEDSGHYPMIDAADTFQRLLLDFLALESGALPRTLQPRQEWHRRMR